MKPEQNPALRLIPTIDSEKIFQGNREVLIQHEQDIYRLIITKAGKLVLNK